MKKILFSLLAITTITCSVTAQTQRDAPAKTESTSKEKRHRDGGKHDKTHAARMAEKLGLTDAQKQQLKSIDEDYKSQAMNLDKSASMPAEELKSKKAELRQQKMQKTLALLTPEQKSKLQEMKKENRGKEKAGSGKGMEKMQSDLGLSSEQVEKMKAQKKMYASKKEAIKNNQSLTMEQKHEQLKSLNDEKMNSFKSSLTPEQLKKLEERKHRRSAKAA